MNTRFVAGAERALFRLTQVAENCKSARRQVNNDAARKEEVPAGSADDVTSAAHKTKQTAKGKRRKKVGGVLLTG